MNEFFKAMLSASHSTKMKKPSYVDSALWINEHQWLVSISNRSSVNNSLSSYVKVIIEGMMQEKRFLVEYRVISDTNKMVREITRLLHDSCRLNYGNQRTVSYSALPRECQMLDLHLEELSNLLVEHEGIHMSKPMQKKFRIKTHLFSWCMDQIEKTVILR